MIDQFPSHEDVQDSAAQEALRSSAQHLGMEALSGALTHDVLPQYSFDYEDDGDLEEWLGDPPGDTEESRKKDTIVQLYMQGVEIPEGEDWDGITGADIRTWRESLTDAEGEDFDRSRDWEARKTDVANKIKAELEQSAPELLSGRLPADLEALVGGSYQLGVNQSGVDTLEDAQAVLQKFNGVDMGMYNLDQRFLIADKNTPDYAAEAVTYGYYGRREGSPAMGKFVAVIPGENYHQDLPSDFWVSNGNTDGNIYKGSEAANAKYIAGFIDDQGKFHRNNNFMRSEVPDLTTDSEPDRVTDSPTIDT